jgi:hypothetical protein
MAKGAEQRIAAMMSRDMDAGVDLIGVDRSLESARSASGGYNRILRLGLRGARGVYKADRCARDRA